MTPYNQKAFNCAHYAIEKINEFHSAQIRISNGAEWQVEFIKKMRDIFTPTKTPSKGALVVMRQMDGGFHLGFYDSGVWHNYSADEQGGSVIKSDLGLLRTIYKRVDFYDYNQTL